MSRREQIRQQLQEGVSSAEIARRLGIARATVAHHLRALGVPADPRFARRYDWADIQRYYDGGRTVRECLAHFGCSSESWHAARQRGDLVTRPAGMTLEELLSKPRNRSHLKKRLIRLGLKEDRCETCGLTEWRGRPIGLALHHVNGMGDDNRLDNLAILCPNCHSQTDTFGSRNKGRRRRLAAVPPKAAC